MGLEVVLQMVLFAALASGAIFALLFVCSDTPLAHAITPLALAAGFIAGYWCIEGQPELVPSLAKGAKGSLPHVAFLAALVGWATSLRSAKSHKLFTLVAIVASVSCAYLLLRASMAFAWVDWPPHNVLLVVLGASLAFLCVFLLYTRAADGPSPLVTVFLLGLVAAGSAPAVLFSDVITGAQLSGAVGVSVGVGFLFVWLGKRTVNGAAVAVAVGGILAGLWLLAFVQSEMPLATLIGLSVAFPSTLLVSLFSNLGTRDKTILRVALVTVCIAGAVFVGAQRYFAPIAPSADSSDGYDTSYGY